MQHNLEIFYTNIRSIATNYDELLLILHELKVSNGWEFDVIALSETWIKEHQLGLFQIPNYKSFISPRTDGRKSGGVITNIYVRDYLRIIRAEKIDIVGANALLVELEYRDKAQSSFPTSDSVKLILLYRDSSASIKKFVDSLEHVLENDQNSRKIILGDMNINLFDQVESSVYHNKCMANGFLSVQNKATRGPRCIDHVFSNFPSPAVVTKISDYKITDHEIVLISFDSDNMLKYVEEKITVSKTNDQLFKANLQKYNWNWTQNVHNSNLSINSHFEHLISVIQDCRKKATKNKVYKPNKKLKKRQP